MNDLCDKKYFDRLAWLFDHYENLDLNNDEGMLLMMLEFCHKYQMNIDYDLLQQKMRMSTNHIDQLLHQLQQKGYLKLEIGEKGIIFDTSGVYDEKVTLKFEEDLFNTFETEFKRPLTRIELQKMSDWLQLYENRLILYALREAVIRNKYSFDYIDRILVDWTHKGFDAEDIENGKQYENR